MKETAMLTRARLDSGTPTPDTYYPECGAPANAYMWGDSLHPTSPVHEVVARQIAGALRGGRPSACADSGPLSYYWDRLMLHWLGGMAVDESIGVFEHLDSMLGRMFRSAQGLAGTDR